MGTASLKKARKPIVLKAFIIMQLRKTSYRWPARNEALLRARDKQLRVKGRLVWHYRCVRCSPDVIHTRKQVQVDHVVPVVDPLKGFTTWDDYINRMFCSADGFQILCIAHHKEKTEAENLERKLANITPEEAKDVLEKINKKLEKGSAKCGSKEKNPKKALH